MLRLAERRDQHGARRDAERPALPGQGWL